MRMMFKGAFAYDIQTVIVPEILVRHRLGRWSGRRCGLGTAIPHVVNLMTGI